MSARTAAEPFRLDVPAEALSDLRERLARSRWPVAPAAAPWRYGTDAGYLRAVVDYWHDRYDWRRCEAEINRWENYRATIDGIGIHCLVAKGSGPNPPPLLLLHGWPGSIVEMLDLIEPLAHPERHGGDIADAFTVVVPSLPGFGFSNPPPAPITPRAIAGMLHRLMADTFGFDRYFVHGTDFGSPIGGWMAIDKPAAVAALHVNFAPMRPWLGEGSAALAPDELAWLDAVKRRTDGEFGYQQMQGTKPQTVAYALTDSPIGLAGWILEKFHGWTVPGENRAPPIAIDRLLDNVSLHWFGGIGASLWLYCALVDGTADVLAPGERVEVPTGFLLFPDDILPPPPEAWLRRVYQVVRRRVAPRGGHFPAFENAPLLIEDIRDFLRPYRNDW